MTHSFLNKKFRYAYWNVTEIILGLNIIFYILTTLFDIRIAGIGLKYWMSLIPVFVNRGYVWQFVTYMFVHGDLSHIIFNMYALVMFGTNLERMTGSKEFLLYYMLCGIAGGIFSYFVNVITGSVMSVTLGASGAIYALMFLVSVLFPDSRVLLFFCIPMRMPLAVLVFMLIEIASQVFGTGAGVAHLVHLSSIIAGWIYCMVRFRISPAKVYRAILSRH